MVPFLMSAGAQIGNNALTACNFSGFLPVLRSVLLKSELKNIVGKVTTQRPGMGVTESTGLVVAQDG